MRDCLDRLAAAGIDGQPISLRDKTSKGCKAWENCHRN
jgi:multimeric flavodoxin WrbA